MRSLEEIDRDLEIAYADMKNFIHSGMHISPVLEDDIDELRDERAAVVKAMQDAGLMRYEGLHLAEAGKHVQLLRCILQDHGHKQRSGFRAWQGNLYPWLCKLRRHRRRF